MGDDNPYLPPHAEAAPVVEIGFERANVSRGLAYGACGAALGIFAAFAFCMSLSLIERARGITTDVDFERDGFDLMGGGPYSLGFRLRHTAPGIAVVLGLAAILNWTPPYRLGIARSVVLTAAMLVCGLMVSSFAAMAFGFQQFRGAREPWKDWLSWSIAMFVPIAYALTHTVVRSTRPAPPTNRERVND